MAELNVDREIALIVPFLYGAMVTTGLVAPDALFIDLSQSLYNIPGAGDITFAVLLQIGALGAVILNRSRSPLEQIRDFEVVEMWIVYATIGMIIAPPLVPTISEVLTQQPAAIIAVLVQAAGFGLVSYLN